MHALADVREAVASNPLLSDVDRIIRELEERVATLEDELQEKVAEIQRQDEHIDELDEHNQLLDEDLATANRHLRRIEEAADDLKATLNHIKDLLQNKPEEAGTALDAIDECISLVEDIADDAYEGYYGTA